MQPPAFDPAEALNQAISATATLVGVLVGGWLAFRLGVKQLRQERALDRRLDWQEKLLTAIDDYQTVLAVLLAQYEKPSSDPAHDLRNYALGESTRLGRELQSLLRRAELYGTMDERAYASHLFKTQLDLYIATWSYSTNPLTEGHRLLEIGKLIVALNESKTELVSRIRQELAMPEIPNHPVQHH
jgi:hypothetical protein